MVHSYRDRLLFFDRRGHSGGSGHGGGSARRCAGRAGIACRHERCCRRRRCHGKVGHGRLRGGHGGEELRGNGRDNARVIRQQPGEARKARLLDVRLAAAMLHERDVSRDGRAASGATVQGLEKLVSLRRGGGGGWRGAVEAAAAAAAAQSTCRLLRQWVVLAHGSFRGHLLEAGRSLSDAHEEFVG